MGNRRNTDSSVFFLSLPGRKGMQMDREKRPRSLRSRLMTVVLLCWLLPLFCLMVLGGVLLSREYERSSRQELEALGQNATEQLRMRLDAVFEASKEVSYHGIVRNSYRLYEKNGDGAALYKTVSDYLNQNFLRDERIQAALLSFWECPEIRPYVAARSDYGYEIQREYRETIEPDLLEKVKDIDTGILVLEYGGELYVARNLLDSHFRPYATVVLRCDRDRLFQSLEPLMQLSRIRLWIDGRLWAGTPEEQEDSAGCLRFDEEASGHTLRLETEIAPFDFWRDVPQIRLAAVFVIVLVLPLLLVMLYLFRRLVTRPVEILVEANQRLEDGERGYAIAEKADSREFARLFRHFNTMSGKLKAQFEQSYLEQQALQQARMKALQSQINPHFLNNTLEIINWEARLSQNERVCAMIEALSVMMNGALGRDGRGQIPLREELGYVDAYLYIIRERLGPRLEVVKEIDGELLEVMVPRLILQPLAENAVEHDLTPRRGGQLCLRAERKGEKIVLEVEHDGVLKEEDRRAAEEMLASETEDTAVSGQVVLRNVRQRLRLLYGEEGELQLLQSGPERILARVSFPVSPQAPAGE